MVIVHQDIYLRQPMGSQFADLVLPAATWGEADFSRWVNAAVADTVDAEVSLRLVDADEGARLNQRYRSAAKPTNVLWISHAPVVRHDQPHWKYEVKLEVNRPDYEYRVSDEFAELLKYDQFVRPRR